MTPTLKKLTKKYWDGATQFSIAQEMKKEKICRYDMDCYRILLTCVQKMYRDK